MFSFAQLYYDEMEETEDYYDKDGPCDDEDENVQRACLSMMQGAQPAQPQDTNVGKAPQDTRHGGCG